MINIVGSIQGPAASDHFKIKSSLTLKESFQAAHAEISPRWSVKLLKICLYKQNQTLVVFTICTRFALAFDVNQNLCRRRHNQNKIKFTTTLIYRIKRKITLQITYAIHPPIFIYHNFPRYDKWEKPKITSSISLFSHTFVISTTPSL